MSKYCSKCGEKLDSDVKYCPKCGTNTDTEYVNTTTNNNQPKSKIAAGILGIFLGAFGIHNFYLGYTSKAVAQLLLTTIGWIACGMGPIASVIWGFTEAILILTGSIDKDADGNKLQD